MNHPSTTAISDWNWKQPTWDREGKNEAICKRFRGRTFALNVLCLPEINASGSVMENFQSSAHCQSVASPVTSCDSLQPSELTHWWMSHFPALHPSTSISTLFTKRNHPFGTSNVVLSGTRQRFQTILAARTQRGRLSARNARFDAAGAMHFP